MASVSFAITGTLSGMDKAEAKRLLTARGHVFSDGVTRNTDYLVVAALNFRKTTNQIESAKRKSVQIITQDEFEELLGIDNLQKKETIAAVRHRSPVNYDWVKETLPYRSEICYHDEDGVITDRVVTVIAQGRRTRTTGEVAKYLQIRDHGDDRIKTFSLSRVVSKNP